MIIRLEGIRPGADRLKALRALRTFWYFCPPRQHPWGEPTHPSPKEAQEMLDRMPIALEICSDDLWRFREAFMLAVVPDPEPEPVVPHPHTFVTAAFIEWPEGSVEITGDAKDIADTIYALLERGVERDKIRVGVPIPCGGGPQA